ncbi:MAG TPA: multidrug efflux SMR transporter [Ornithinibacter sp.]|jgi:small multidrug resistance pump|nr:multidrug efflux SMR transporter [Ornithinibacter sp.]
MITAWVLLVAAIGIEVTATAALPRTAGFHDPGWSAAVVVGYAASIWLLTLVVERMPVSVAYAVWAGLGTAGIAVVGYLFLGESLDWVKALAIGLIIVGVVVLNATGSH